MGFPPPQYNISLAPNQINPELPFYPIYGVTPDNKYIPIAVDADGKLSVGDITISGPVTINDVVIKGVDPDAGNTSHDVSVVNWGINGYDLRTSIFYQGNALLVNPDGSINVNTSNLTVGAIDKSAFVYGTNLEQPIGGVYQDASPTVPAGTTGAVRITAYRALQVNLRDSSGNEIFPATEATLQDVEEDLDQFKFDGSGALIVTGGGSPVVTGIPVNVFAENTTVPSGVLTTILTYTVPASQVFQISGIVGWGTYDGEFVIAVDGVAVGGGWCSPSDRTLELIYDSATITANAAQVVTVRVTHYSSTTEDFKANLLGNLYSTIPSSIWGIPVNVYNDISSVPPSVETTVLTYTVPLTKTLSILGIYGWGNYDGEFTVRVNGVQVGGGWSSPSDRTLFVDFSSAPVGASAVQVVTVNVTQYGTSSYDFQANLLGGLK